jgi:hypothetical protein
MLEFFKFTETDEFEGETWNFYVPLTEEQEARIRELVAATDEQEVPYSLSEEPVTEEEVDDLMATRGTTTVVAEHNKCGPLDTDLPPRLSSEYDFLHKGAPFDVIETCLAPNERDEDDDSDAQDDYA